MSVLKKPKFKKLHLSSFGGAPLLLSLWNYFDISLLLTQSGIYKQRGTPTWKLAFLFVVGLISRCGSCLKILDFYEKDSLLQRILNETITQSVFSRFMVAPFNWNLFNLKRVAAFQKKEETRLVDGDVIALDDSLVVHNHARKMPFVYNLFDHCSQSYVSAINIVALYAKKSNALQYPLLYCVWKKDNGKEPYNTKLDLALEMLKQLRNQLNETVRCFVAMDRGYFSKNFYQAVEELDFDWVARVKTDIPLYRRTTVHGKERLVGIRPNVLFKEARHSLSLGRKKGLKYIGFKDVYLVKEEIHNGQGYLKGRVLKPVNAVVTVYLEEDKQTGRLKHTLGLLLSNKVEASAQTIVKVYKDRWSIENFFRNGKQELCLNECHSTDENHHHAHLSLMMVAESLVRYAQWKYKEKTDMELEEVTHGQAVAFLFHIRCEVHAKSKDSVQIYFDMKTERFASFFHQFWPKEIGMRWFNSQRIWNPYPLTG